MNILPGMNDIGEEEYNRKRQVKDALQTFFSLYGYSIIDTPILERTDTFVRKSAEEVSSHLYTFTDRNDNSVSLRPEFTSGVIRSFIENEPMVELPARWQYNGPVFRFENNKRREFSQIGVELIGTSSPKADCEVIALATQSLTKLGISGQEVVIGHMGAIRELLLQLDLSTRARSFLLASMSRLKQPRCTMNTIMEEARGIGILQDKLKSPASQYDVSSTESLDWDKLFLGNRTQEEIIDRLERKSRGQSDYNQIERGLLLIESLSKIQGPPDKVLEEARKVVKNIGFKEDPFKDLEESLGLLNYHDLSSSTVIVDLGLTRDATYYTGLIFEIRHRLLPKELSLAGGGRYDGLIRAMGGKTDTPAAGFAFALESLISILGNSSNIYTGAKAINAAIPAVFSKTPDSYENAIRLADSRRLNGDPAEVRFDGEAADIEKIIASGSLCKDIIVVDKYNNVEEYKVGK